MNEQEAVKRLEQHKEWGFSEPTMESIDCAIAALEEVQQYRAMQNDIIKNNAELLEYREIGTVKACRAAVKKQIPKKPHIWGERRNYEGHLISEMYNCPCCGNKNKRTCENCTKKRRCISSPYFGKSPITKKWNEKNGGKKEND